MLQTLPIHSFQTRKGKKIILLPYVCNFTFKTFEFFPGILFHKRHKKNLKIYRGSIIIYLNHYLTLSFTLKAQVLSKMLKMWPIPFNSDGKKHHPSSISSYVSACAFWYQQSFLQEGRIAKFQILVYLCFWRVTLPQPYGVKDVGWWSIWIAVCFQRRSGFLSFICTDL